MTVSGLLIGDKWPVRGTTRATNDPQSREQCVKRLQVKRVAHKKKSFGGSGSGGALYPAGVVP